MSGSPAPSNYQFWQFRRFWQSLSAALCLCPSARPPPGIAPLLKAKGKPQFDKTVTRQSKPFFLVFPCPNCVSFGLRIILFSKTTHWTHLTRSQCDTLPFVRLFCQGKIALLSFGDCRAHGVEQAFMPAVKSLAERTALRAVKAFLAPQALREGRWKRQPAANALKSRRRALSLSETCLNAPETRSRHKTPCPQGRSGYRLQPPQPDRPVTYRDTMVESRWQLL
jgi:hypothetical protein